ncbi:MAG: hypothetical protein DRP74_07080 [Candidatus Omnitrophota bacterium]|nr:MAG: hypothetical protein DRP74_07080 [Candidatus Omnitrophota bacterium]
MNKIGYAAYWLLRLVLISVFLYHGLTKFSKVQDLAKMMNMSTTAVITLALVEAIGAIFIFLGGFLKDWVTRLGALLLIPVMVGAIFMVHWGQWSFAPTEQYPMGGMEFQVMLLAVLLYVLAKGNKS